MEKGVKKREYSIFGDDFGVGNVGWCLTEYIKYKFLKYI